MGRWPKCLGASYIVKELGRESCTKEQKWRLWERPFCGEKDCNREVSCLWNRQPEGREALLLQELPTTVALGSFPFKRATKGLQRQICLFFL